MSKDRASALCRALDERVEAFRSRPSEGDFPNLWLDAKQLKIRDRGPRALPPDLVERNFTATRPNALCVADFCHLRWWQAPLRRRPAGNLDGYTMRTGFAISSEQQLTLNATLANAAHRLGLRAAFENDPRQARVMVPLRLGHRRARSNRHEPVLLPAIRV